LFEEILHYFCSDPEGQLPKASQVIPTKMTSGKIWNLDIPCLQQRIQIVLPQNIG
jgi:hypothetical protein